jgi:hypothetical protein
LVEMLWERSDRQRLAEAICRKLVSLGWTSLMLEHLARDTTPAGVRMALMDLLMEAPTDEFLALLDRLDKNDDPSIAAKALFVRTRITIGYGSVSSGTAG